MRRLDGAISDTGVPPFLIVADPAGCGFHVMNDGGDCTCDLYTADSGETVPKGWETVWSRNLMKEASRRSHLPPSAGVRFFRTQRLPKLLRLPDEEHVAKWAEGARG